MTIKLSKIASTSRKRLISIMVTVSCYEHSPIAGPKTVTAIAQCTSTVNSLTVRRGQAAGTVDIYLKGVLPVLHCAYPFMSPINWAPRPTRHSLRLSVIISYNRHNFGVISDSLEDSIFSVHESPTWNKRKLDLSPLSSKVIYTNIRNCSQVCITPLDKKNSSTPI